MRIGRWASTRSGATRRDVLDGGADLDGGVGEGLAERGRECPLLVLESGIREVALAHDGVEVDAQERDQHRYYHLDHSPLETIEDWLILFLSVDFDAVVREGDFADAGLKDEQRAFATALGKAFADTSVKVSAAVKDVAPKKWRRYE